MTDDSRVARTEDQDSPEHGDMSPKGGKGPSRASAAPTQGAFGDQERDDGNYDNVEETLIKGAKNVGPKGSQ